MQNPKNALKQPHPRLILRRFTRFSVSGRTSPPYTVARPIIFKPLEILYAAWRYQQSKLFLIILVNLARLAPSWRWLRPKYCSTIYRTLDIFLLRSFSYLVNLAVVESFLIIPSSILFRDRKSRLGFLHPVESSKAGSRSEIQLGKYPLSANTFSMGCFV